MISQNCLTCNKIFETKPSYVARGHGKYCSVSCSNRANKTVEKEPNVECAYCSAPFYKTLSKQKNSRSGLFFCCREHKDLAQQMGGIEAIQPSHYGKGDYARYRIKAFRHLEHSCNKCKYSDCIAVLEVHHKDRNHSNNKLSNLEILCPTCHRIEHHLHG